MEHRQKNRRSTIIVVVFSAAVVAVFGIYLWKKLSPVLPTRVNGKPATSQAQVQAVPEGTGPTYLKLGETYEDKYSRMKYTALSFSEVKKLPDNLEKEKLADDVKECTGSDCRLFLAEAEVENTTGTDREVRIDGVCNPEMISHVSEPLYVEQNPDFNTVYFSAAENPNTSDAYTRFTVKAGEKKKIRIYYSLKKTSLESFTRSGDTQLYLELDDRGSSTVDGAVLVKVDALQIKTPDTGIPKIYQLGKTCEAAGLRYTLNSVAEASKLPPDAGNSTGWGLGRTYGYNGKYVCVTMTVENPGVSEVEKRFNVQLADLLIIRDAATKPVYLRGQFAAYFTNHTRETEKVSGTDYDRMLTYRFHAGGRETIRIYYEMESDQKTRERLTDALGGKNRKLYLEVGKDMEKGFDKTPMPWSERTLFEVNRIDKETK